jgi:phage/plasmid-associated DNA primase
MGNGIVDAAIGIVLSLDLQLAVSIVKLHHIWLIRDIENGSLIPVFYERNMYVEDRLWDRIRGFIKDEIIGLFSFLLSLNQDKGEGSRQSRFLEYHVSNKDKKGYATSSGYINHLVSQVVKCIRDISNIVKEETDFDSNPYLIKVKNGIFDILKGILMPHTPALLIRGMINANFIPPQLTSNGMKIIVTKTNLFREFIGSALYDKTKNDRENKAIVRSFLEILASFLIGSNEHKLLFIIVGKPNTGKTTLLNTLKTLFSLYGTWFNNSALLRSARTTNDIRPDILALRGKRLIVGSEANKDGKFDTALLKSLAGNDEVSFRKPHKGDMVTFRICGKFMLVTNFCPKFTDLDDQAFLNRIVLVNFDNIPERMDGELEDKLKSPEMLDKIFTELANLAHNQVVGGKINIHERFKANKQRILVKQNSSVARFWNAHIRPMEEYNVPARFLPRHPVKLLYSVMYRDFCSRDGVKPLLMEAFAKDFKMLSDQFPTINWEKGESNNFYIGFDVEGGMADQYHRLQNDEAADSMIEMPSVRTSEEITLFS